MLICFISSALTPLMHQSIYFEENHKRDGKKGLNTLNLNFNIDNFKKTITLLRGYTFIIKFPSSSALKESTSVNCGIKVGGNEIPTDHITQETDVDAGIVKCICSDKFALEGVKLDKTVMLMISNLSLNSNLYDLIQISLETSKSNGTLIVQNPAFDRSC